MVSAIISAYKTDINQLQWRLRNLKKQGCQRIAICQSGSPEDAFFDRLGPNLHPEVVLLTPDVPTIYKAWNLGLAASNEEFITNANSDDLLYDDALNIMCEALKENPEYALVYANSDIVKKYCGYPVNRFEWSEGGHAELLQRCFIGPMPVWRRSLHEKYGFFDEEMQSAGDYEFWLRLASSGEKFLHLKRCLGAFYAHSDSASMREPLRSLWESSRARSRYPLNKEI